LLDPATIYALDDINWSFSGNMSPTRSAYGLLDARNIHWYPATYIPEIPYSLIELLSRPGDRVMDPFAGIGTTVWQALALGREAFGGELTLIGQNSCRDIWALLSHDTNLRETEDDLDSRLNSWSGEDFSKEFMETERGALLAPWYSVGTFKELAFLAHIEEALVGRPAFHLFRLSTSAVLASVSEQRRGWGCIADNMKPREGDFMSAPPSRNPIDRVLKKASLVTRSIASARERLRYPEDYIPMAQESVSHIFGGDSLTSGALAPSQGYDLIVTSPPYPAMVDYSTAQRLSYYWNGLSPELDVSKEIGARRRRFSSSSLLDYTAEMINAVDAMKGSLKVGGKLALVIPVFTTAGADDPRTIALQAVFGSPAASGLELCWQTDRILPTGRRQLNQKWTSLQRENIRIYERTR
jgi:hypothetical protein